LFGNRHHTVPVETVLLMQCKAGAIIWIVVGINQFVCFVVEKYSGIDPNCGPAANLPWSLVHSSGVAPSMPVGQSVVMLGQKSNYAQNLCRSSWTISFQKNLKNTVGKILLRNNDVILNGNKYVNKKECI
jgi:hypothetical protein